MYTVNGNANTIVVVVVVVVVVVMFSRESSRGFSLLYTKLNYLQHL